MGAVALLLGQDPVTFASYEGVERIYYEACLTRAWSLHVDEVKARAAGGLLG